MKAADKRVEARARLVEAERALRRHNFIHVANCLARFLNGEAGTLDEAFGIAAERKRGRPVVRETRHLAIARAVLNFRLSDAASEPGSIGSFEEALAGKYNLSDARKVREIYAKYRNIVMAEELTKQLSEDR